MKAKLVESLPSGDWIYEIKFDGYRALPLRGGSDTPGGEPLGPWTDCWRNEALLLGSTGNRLSGKIREVDSR
jgi:hypothetical protein